MVKPEIVVLRIMVYLQGAVLWDSQPVHAVCICTSTYIGTYIKPAFYETEGYIPNKIATVPSLECDEYFFLSLTGTELLLSPGHDIRHVTLSAV